MRFSIVITSICLALLAGCSDGSDPVEDASVGDAGSSADADAGYLDSGARDMSTGPDLSECVGPEDDCTGRVCCEGTCFTFDTPDGEVTACRTDPPPINP